MQDQCNVKREFPGKLHCLDSLLGVLPTMQVFGCEFFLSYGMTECCGKISMSILPEDVSHLSGANLAKLVANGSHRADCCSPDSSSSDKAVHFSLMSLHSPRQAGMSGICSAVEDQIRLVCSSGRPFELMDVRVVNEQGQDVAKDSHEVPLDDAYQHLDSLLVQYIHDRHATLCHWRA